jgi:hypothetical protein
MSTDANGQDHNGSGTGGGRFRAKAHTEPAGVLAGARVDTVTDQYLETALWSSTGEDGEPLDDDHSTNDIAPAALAQARADVESFLESNAKPIDQAKALVPTYDDASVAHDFWLTRNGHGAGFWDRGLGAVGDELTKNAKPYGECDPYVGDDGLVYLT